MEEIIKIHVAFFRAGYKYKWIGEYRPAGVGINEEYLKGTGSIKVQIGNDSRVYTITKEKAMHIVKNYKAWHFANDKVALAVIPVQAFDVLPDKNQLQLTPAGQRLADSVKDGEWE